VNDTKALGVFTYLSSKSKGSTKRMQDKEQKWSDSTSGAKLHHYMLWISAERQFWPSAGFGLYSSMAFLKELDNALNSKFQYKMAPLGGIVCTYSEGIR